MDSNKKVTSGFLWIYLENTSAQIVSFLVTIVLARLLEPTHYGTIALLTVFIALAQIFVTSGISSALIQKKMLMNLIIVQCSGSILQYL